VRAILSGKLQHFCLAQCNLWNCFISVPVYQCAGIRKLSSPCPKCILNGSLFPTLNSRALFICFLRVKRLRDSVRQLFSPLKHSSCRPGSLQLVPATLSLRNLGLNQTKAHGGSDPSLNQTKRENVKNIVGEEKQPLKQAEVLPTLNCKRT